jgi:hypothetical protein
MWITSSGKLWEIESDGFARGPSNTSVTASDITATAAGPHLISGSPSLRCDDSCLGPPWWGSCTSRCVRFFYGLRLAAPDRVIESSEFEFLSRAQPAIESDGEKLVVAWLRGTQTEGGQVVLSPVDPARRSFPVTGAEALVLGRFRTDYEPARPDIAVTAEGTFVVWHTRTGANRYDVVGAFLARDGSVEELTIAASGADERDPSIIVLGNGGVLIAYRKIEKGENRIAWRVIGSQARRRSVR